MSCASHSDLLLVTPDRFLEYHLELHCCLVLGFCPVLGINLGLLALCVCI